MEEQVQKAFDIANYMTTLAGQKRILLEEYHQNRSSFYAKKYLPLRWK